MKTFVFTLLITPLLWLQRAQSQVGLLQKPGGRRGGRETREGGQHHSDLVGETREESPERGIQPKGRHPGTGPLDVPIQHTPASTDTQLWLLSNSHSSCPHALLTHTCSPLIFHSSAFLTLQRHMGSKRDWWPVKKSQAHTDMTEDVEVMFYWF